MEMNNAQCLCKSEWEKWDVIDGIQCTFSVCQLHSLQIAGMHAMELLSVIQTIQAAKKKLLHGTKEPK